MMMVDLFRSSLLSVVDGEQNIPSPVSPPVIEVEEQLSKQMNQL